MMSAAHNASLTSDVARDARGIVYVEFVFAFMPLTQSVFWGSMAYTLIGGTAAGTALILLFLPALYAIWFRIRPLAPVKDTRIVEELQAAAQ